MLGSSHCVAAALNSAAICGAPDALASGCGLLSSMKTSMPPPLKGSATPEAFAKRYLIAALLPSTRRQVTGPSSSNAVIGEPKDPKSFTTPLGFSPAGPLRAPSTLSRSDPGPVTGFGKPLSAEPATRSPAVPSADAELATTPPTAAASASAAAIHFG